eukprot:jgi/Mesvir1/18741/Mv01250-RA.1
MVKVCWISHGDPTLRTPSVVVDNPTSETYTLIKVDSVNRRGSLLEVVQTLCDLQLDIKKAFISSDGGWFVDVFHVTDEAGRKIVEADLCQRIQQKLEEVSSNFAGVVLNSTHPIMLRPMTNPEEVQEVSMLEIYGHRLHFLLPQVSSVLSRERCSISSASVWTHRLRMAAILYFTELPYGGPIRDEGRLTSIREQVAAIMQQSSDGAEGVARTKRVIAPTHQERRLHQLMMDRGHTVEEGMAVTRWGQESAAPAGGTPNGTVIGGLPGYSLGNSNASSTAGSESGSPRSLGANSLGAAGNSHGAGGSNYNTPDRPPRPTVGAAPPDESAHANGGGHQGGANGAMGGGSAAGGGGGGGGANSIVLPPRQTLVEIRDCTSLGYTLLRIQSKDRLKLLFDTVCTLTDMKYDVFHATIECINGMAIQEFYVRKSTGGMLDSALERNFLTESLEAAIERRIPQILSADRPSLLSDITKVLYDAGLVISCAEVKTFRTRVVDVFWLVDKDGKALEKARMDKIKHLILASSVQVCSIDYGRSKDVGGKGPVDAIAAAIPRGKSEQLLWHLGLGKP